MGLADISKIIIRYSFYALFFLVPLVFTTDNSELFELSKMWLTWGIAAVITTAWITRMVITRKFHIQRTPLDIPILLFLSSQIISTLFSLDMRISLWGYYSRFNGGLLSTITYIVLYYALVSNLGIKSVRRILYTSIASATLVVLWGLPAHFGIDPTCYIVRGSFDISCWTDQFVPTVRIFSTLGQPAWMAAYISFLLPVILALLVKTLFSSSLNPTRLPVVSKAEGVLRNFFSPLAIYYSLLTILFYIALLFANTRAGFLAFLIGNAFFWGVLLIISFRKYFLPFTIYTILFALCNLIFGIPIPQLQQYSVGTKVQQAVMKAIAPPVTPQVTTPTNTVPASATQEEQGVANITDSGNIRKNVWRGAMTAWSANPIFGTGVETFAFAYYRHKPVEQNTTSEWDYLYNKAHNEYLNYLATTGIYGLATYLLLIGWFWFLMIKWLLHTGYRTFDESKTSTVLHWILAELLHLFKHTPKESLLKPEYAYLTLGLLAGLLTIYISNFFGFSVVIVNLYLFLTPGFIFILLKKLDPTQTFPASVEKETLTEISSKRYGVIGTVWLLCFYFLYLLFRFWDADKAYALGYNLNRVNQFQDAYVSLVDAVKKREHEPVFQDELSYSSAVLAAAYAEQKDEQNTQQYANQAITLSDQVIKNHPNNIVFLKNRVRMLYELSKVNPQYLTTALQSIEKAYTLAPNDVKIAYNYGVLLGQTGQITQGIQILEKTREIKPDFRDVYFALGLFYRDLATNGGKTVVNKEYELKAEENLQYILKNLNPDDKLAREQLTSWGVK